MDKSVQSETGHAGSRVRERRISAGIKQAELAARVGISPSYLNLIEHNRRRIGGKLLVALATGLGVDPQFLSAGAEPGLIENLHDASMDQAAKKTLGKETNRIEEFAERFPGWAQMISVQRQRIAQLEGIIDGLNDRLTHDPVLSDTMHDVLSTASAIRSTASILVATPDIDAEWRHRFHNNIDTESRRLAETSAAMAEHFEHLTRASATFITPLEATQALFDANGHHFEAIETRGAAAIDEVLQEAQPLAGEALRMARLALEDYAARARIFPADALFAELKANGFSSLAQVAAGKGVGLDVLLTRLAELPHNPEIPEMGCVQCDGAGALVRRNAVAGFAIPRFGAACNLWPVFSALAAPNQPLRSVIKSSDGTRFTTYSIATLAYPAGFDAPAIYRATMLLVADGTTAPARDIGPACRVCPHKSCPARREPSILDSIAN